MLKTRMTDLFQVRSRFIRSFDVLPHRSQMTCGGVPSRSISPPKSLSFVITTAPACLAARKIS